MDLTFSYGKRIIYGMKILDLFCGAGGASMGIVCAGHEVVGLDNNPEVLREYPFECICADALEYPLGGFDAYFASPPCQAYSWAAKRWGREYLDLIGETRARLLKTGKPFVIENVIGAPLRKDLMLCGTMFGLKIFRHRVFEIEGFLVFQPHHFPHKYRIGQKGYVTVAGHGGDGSGKFGLWKEAMGIDWMSKKSLTQAIPPLYTEYIFSHLRA